MITFWHNPRCSKSRQALALLEDANAKVTVRKYLVDRPSREEMDHVSTLLGLPASAMIRRGEGVFKDHELGDVEDENVLMDMMVEFPILIERPIALLRDRGVIGRPPEAVLTLLT